MRNIAPKLFNINSATSPLTVQIGSDTEVITFYGNKTLAATFAIQASGTPVNNCTITMLFTGVITSAGNTFTIFDTTIVSDVIKAPFVAVCFYTDATWIVWYAKLSSLSLSTGGGLTLDTGGGLKIDSNVIVNAMINTAAAISYSKLALTGSILNADISGSAAITYAKLLLTDSIVNADINSAASIAYSKLLLTGSIINDDINSAAVIDLAKLAPSTNDVIPKFGSSGLLEPTSTTPTQLSYCDFTSSGQTQMNTKASTSYVDAADGVLAAAIAAKDTNIKSYSTISGNTTLTAATIKQNIRINALTGSVDITLPDSSTVAAGYTTHWVVMGANAVRLLAHAAQNIRDLTDSDVAALTITGDGNRIDTVNDGTNTFYES